MTLPAETDPLAPLRDLALGWRASPWRQKGECGRDLAAALPALEAEIARLREAPRACGCRTPDPVMQADERFYCYQCSFQTGARPANLEPENYMILLRAAEAKVESLEAEIIQLRAERDMLAEAQRAATEQCNGCDYAYARLRARQSRDADE